MGIEKLSAQPTSQNPTKLPNINYFYSLINQAENFSTHTHINEKLMTNQLVIRTKEKINKITSDFCFYLTSYFEFIQIFTKFN